MDKTRQRRSVLIIHTSGTGDILQSSPIASALKASDRDIAITWVVHPAYAPLLEGHPDIDNVITFAVDEWTALWRRIQLLRIFLMARELRRKLELYEIDCAIDLQATVPSGIIALLSGAPQRIALGSNRANSCFMTKTISRSLGDQIQIGSQYRYLVNQLGCTDRRWEMYAPTLCSARTRIRQRLIDKIDIDGTPYAVVCPFSKRPQNNWFDDYWMQIILRVRGRYHLRTIILGSHGRSPSAERISRLTGAINLAGETSIAESTALIRQASLLVGVDTDLTHIGHAVKVPTISLFGATYPYAFVENTNSKVIYLDRFCSPCGDHPICARKYHCMREITPDKVLTNIKSVLKSSPTGTPAHRYHLTEQL